MMAKPRFSSACTFMLSDQNHPQHILDRANVWRCIYSDVVVHIYVLENIYFQIKIQGPVVQSIVSLTSSLRVISLTILADSIYNILTFFAEKCE